MSENNEDIHEQDTLLFYEGEETLTCEMIEAELLDVKPNLSVIGDPQGLGTDEEERNLGGTAPPAEEAREPNCSSSQNRHSEKKKGVLLTIEKRMERLTSEIKTLDIGIRQLQITEQKEREKQKMVQKMLLELDKITPEMAKEFEAFLKEIGDN